jgi:hypothetical protein
MRLARSTGRWVVGCAVCGAALFSVTAGAAQSISLTTGGSVNPQRTEGLHDEQPVYGITGSTARTAWLATYSSSASLVPTSAPERWRCGLERGRRNVGRPRGAVIAPGSVGSCTRRRPSRTTAAISSRSRRRPSLRRTRKHRHLRLIRRAKRTVPFRRPTHPLPWPCTSRS